MARIEKWTKLEKVVKRITMQDICLISGFKTAYIREKHNSKEHKVKRDFIEGLSRNSYYVNRILYTLREILSYPDIVIEDKNFTGAISYDSYLPFKFDAFISSSSSLIEAPFKNRIDKYLGKELSKELDEVFPKRNDSKSLFWRLNILRNRAIHVDDETYTEDFGVFGEFSSNFGAISVENGIAVGMHTTLIDIESTPELLPIIESIIKDRTKNFMEEAFGAGRPSGAPKKNQDLKYFSKGMNLIDGFPSIAIQVLNLLDKYHTISAKWFLSKIEHSEFERRWLVQESTEKSMSVIEIFPELKI
ncbi:hypothetical protein [uncultured Lacinutrix sp.]|uniref:hypothetical protein n=1 Tax=uncultured Lacinutrix sp. TaxID=574032 RepID=UPI0026260746|nr:hypothetical protein [uncultured Lacinutrix sp.]